MRFPGGGVSLNPKKKKREDKIVLGLIPIKNNLLKSQYN
jgi:hypothetical protein